MKITFLVALTLPALTFLYFLYRSYKYLNLDKQRDFGSPHPLSDEERDAVFKKFLYSIAFAVLSQLLSWVLLLVLRFLNNTP